MVNYRTRLLLLQLITVVLTTLLLGAGSHLLFLSSIESLQERHLTHLSREGALLISNKLQSLSQRIEHLDMDSFRQRYGDLPLEKHFLEFFRKIPDGFKVVSLLDEKGAEVIKLIDGQPVDSYFNYQFDPVVQMSRRAPNTTQIHGKLQDAELGEPSVRLAHTYVSYFGEKFLGTLVMSLPLKTFDQMLLALTGEEKASLALVSEQGELLTYHRPELTFQPMRVSFDSHPTRHQLSGEDLVAVASPIEKYGWQVVATMPWNLYRAEARKMNGLAVVVCLMITVFGALFSWKMAALLTRNIDQLIEFAERVGQGDYQHQLSLDSTEEFNRLKFSMNNMVLELERHRKSRDAYQNIIETVIDPLIVTNRQGGIVQVNQAALDLFACEEARILSRPLSDLFPDTPKILRRTEFEAGLLMSRVNNLETSIRNCQGDELKVLFSSAPCDTESGNFGVVCILKDITERIAVRDSREKALLLAEDARRRIDALLRSVPDGLVVTDPLGSVMMMNAPAEKMLGKDIERIVLDVAQQMLDESGTLGRAVDIPLTADSDHGLRVIQAHASEVRDAQDKVSGMVMLLRDVSRERSMEQMKNEFISTAAHELRTPLTSILGYSELMLEPDNAERFSRQETQGFLQEILGRAETLARIIDDLLSISRIESGQPLALELTPTDISTVVRRVVDQFRLTANEHRFELNLPGDEVLALVDAGRLQQALENLLGNAVKYSEEASLIRVRGELYPDSYRIIIDDEGLGMSAEQLDQIFDKFYRVDYSNTKTSGLGIGMSIVKQIIEGHAGQIALSSKLGEGTRVEVTLPLQR